MTRGKETTVVAGYVRVSHADQAREGVSLDAQRDRIERYCATNGLTLARVYTDPGVSGGIALNERPDGRALVEAIDRREIAAVCCLKLDRLFRSTVDCLNTVQRWDRQRIALHVLDFHGGALDTRSALGRMMLTMASAFAEMERSLIGERTSAALQHMKRQGVRLGGVPFGFRADSPGGELLPDDRELSAVREILRLRGAGGSQASYRAIARELTRSSVPTRHGGAWKPETVRKIAERRLFYESEGITQTP